MQNDKRQIAENAPIKGGKRVVSGAVLIVCIIVLAIGSVVARYATEKTYSSEMQSASFHISSDYLAESVEGENPKSYTVPHSGAFDICLYNYEKENIAQISKVDITYTVTATNATVAAKGANGTTVSPIANGSSRNLDAADDGALVKQVLQVTPTESASPSSPITVMVQTTSPYSKTLTAQFTVASSMPSYTIADQNDGTVLVTVTTNDYDGFVTLSWNSNTLSPDNTNALMELWTDGSAADGTSSTTQASFAAQRNSTYKLLFFKNTADKKYERPASGTGTEITLE